MDLLDRKLMKLFILAEGIEVLYGKYDYADLFYALLEEIKDAQQVYEEHRETLLNLA